MSAISTGRSLSKSPRGRVNVRLAVMEDGKPAKGSRSFNIENMTTDEALDYIYGQDELADSLTGLASEFGIGTDEVLTVARAALVELHGEPEVAEETSEATAE